MDFKEHLRILVEKRGLTMKELSDRSKVPYRTLQGIMVHGNPTLSSIDSIAKALRMTTPELLSYDGGDYKLELEAKIDAILNNIIEEARKLKEIL